MARSILLLLLFVAVGECFLEQVSNLVPGVVKNVSEALNPIQLFYVNKSIEDLGYFYTGPPFYHAINRPISLPPTSSPKVKFYLFTPSNPDEAYELEITQESLSNSTFDSKFGTTFLVHGFMSDLDYDDDRFEIKDALLRVGNYNVFIVDWTEHNGLPYAQAVANTRVVGALVARMIHFLTNETGITPQSVHLIGHSLGAHTSGYAGKRVPGLGRITGLDPAGPYFQDADREVRLDRTDALFVDVIHTDGAENVLGGLGISDPIGHIDFYPNGGRRQLGCVYSSTGDTAVGAAINFTTKWIQNGCDHGRANLYFLESIGRTACRFLSVQCSSYGDYERGLCPPENSTVVDMGFHLKRPPGGSPPLKFYLRTKSEEPHCLEDSIRL
ncbi:Inactive pancreatic lipase-related protein 1 like protein [Argiope bruennichi]|uniref:Inactive pancreatic lipase-related protein 1 like protein n=2 Tax=Argiope bruennichi TaxID=94029 RepID=A0A8T0F5D9_ARGBR|nr:Inactive pancreatic lipase-related protein 1 like protein [Argiope bruennichi]